MNYIWNPDIQDLIDAQELARKRGKNAGQDYTEEFLEIMNKKGKTPLGATELNKEELIEEYVSHDKQILDVSIDNEGKESYRIIKKKEKEA